MKPTRSFAFSRCLVVVAALAVTTALAQTQNLEPAAAGKPAAKPKNPALVAVEDVPGLPRVLLIGDSISMGYTLLVRERLQGVANVHRPLENCGDTARGLVALDKWLGKKPWDVIHFNFGLHDLKYLNAKGQYVSAAEGQQVAPPEVYRQRLRDFTLRLKASGAKLIFATTTPVPEGATGRVHGDAQRYNQVAREVMEELGVSINDLCAPVDAAQRKLPPLPVSQKPTPPQRAQARPGELQHPFDVHFTPEGCQQLADLVVAKITPLLPAKQP